VPPSHSVDIDPVEPSTSWRSRPPRGHKGDAPTPAHESPKSFVKVDFRSSGSGVLPVEPIEKENLHLP
jgi:hypothetical protein